MKYLTTSIAISLALLSASCDSNKNASELLKDAETSIKSGDTNTAIVQLKNAIQLEPNNAKLRIALADIYFKEGLLINAEKEYNKGQDQGADINEWLPNLIKVNYLLNEPTVIAQLWSEYSDSLSKEYYEITHLFYALSLFNEKKTENGYIELEKIIGYENNNYPQVSSIASSVKYLMDPNVKHAVIQKNVKILSNIANQHSNDWLALMLLSKAQFALGNFQGAAQNYERLVKLLPNYNVAYISAAESNIEAQNNKLADTQLNKLLIKYPDSPYINLLEAKNKLALGDDESAKLAIEKTIAAGYSDETTKVIAGLIYFKKKMYENALYYLNSAAKSLTPNHPIQKVLIATRIYQGDVNNIYNDIIEGNVTDAQIISAAANSLLLANKKEQAAGILKQINIADAPNSQIALELGSLNVAAGNISSLKNIEKIVSDLSKDSANTEAEIQQARAIEIAALMQSNQLEPAINLVNDWIKQQPNNLGNYLLLIEIYRSKNNTDMVDKLYQKTLAIKNDFITAKLHFAAKSLKDKNYKKALAQYEEILVSSPSAKKAILGNYLSFLYLNKKSDAQKFIEKQLSSAKKGQNLELDVAKIFWQTGQYQKAIDLIKNKDFTSVIDSIEKLNIIAASQLRLKNKQEAINTYDGILKLTPKDITTFTKKVLLMEQLGLLQEILSDFTEFRKILFPEDPRINLMHAEYLVHMDRAEESMNILSSYRNTNIEATSTYRQVLGKTLYKLKKFKEAKPLLEEAYRLQKSARISMMLYQTYLSLEIKAKAIELIKNHSEAHPNHLMIRSIYAEHLFNSDKEKAIDEYIALIELDSKNGIALNNLAWIYYEKGNYIDAKKYIDLALEHYPNNANILDTASKINEASNQ